MFKDRSGKILLALATLGLWGVLLRPVASVTPAQAQPKVASPKVASPKVASAPAQPARPPKVMASSDQPMVVMYEDKPLIIIYKGKISTWSLFNEGDGKFRLVQGDTKSLP